MADRLLGDSETFLDLKERVAVIEAALLSGGLSSELQALVDQAARTVRPARPAPPPAPAEVKSVTDPVTAGIPAPGVNAAPAINAALAANGTVILPEHVTIASAIMRPSYSRLLARDGAPCRIECMPGFAGGAGNLFNALVTNQPGASDLLCYNLIADVMGIGAGSDPTRINGFKNLGARRVRMQQTEARRVSGYGNFDQFGVANGDCRDVLWDRAGGSDCSYPFEQMGADTYMLDCWADAGAATQNLSAPLHPVAGSSLTVIRFKARGAYIRGVYILADEGRAMERLYFEDLDIDVTGGSFNFEVQPQNGGSVKKLIIINSRFKGKQGTSLRDVDARIFASTFETDSGANNAEAFVVNGATTKVSMDAASRIVARSASNVFGLAINSLGAEVEFDGSVEGTASGVVYPVSGPGLPGLRAGPSAKFVPGGSINNASGLLDHDPSHINATIFFTEAMAQTYRVNSANGNYTPPVGATVYLRRLGPGVPSVLAGAGVTITAEDGLGLAAPLASGKLVCSGPNAWTLAIEAGTSSGSQPPSASTSLGNSLPLTGYGAQLTFGSLDADGFYPFTTTGVSGGGAAVGTNAAVTGDSIVEIDFLAPTALFLGADTEAPFAFRSYGELTEALQLDVSGSPTFVFWQGGGFTGVTKPYGNRLYMHHVGATVNFYTGASWAAALAAGAFHTMAAAAATTAGRFIALIEIGINANARVKVVEA